MLFKKNNYKLTMEGNSIVDEKIHKKFLLEKNFTNRIKLNAFLIRLKYEMKKFNNEKTNEENMKMSKEEIENTFPKMNELFQTESDNYLFQRENEINKIVDSVEFGMVDIKNKKNKSIFHKDFSELIEEKDLESI